MSFQNYLDYLKIGKTKLISNHYSLYDTCNSSTAKTKQIDNTIPVQLVPNAILVTTKVLEPLCSHFKTRPDVSCMFRCETLNKDIGGVPTSQHCEAKAADFIIAGVQLKDIVEYIRHNLEFDQCILENTWVHCSYNSIHNRKQVLKNVNGKYIPY